MKDGKTNVKRKKKMSKAKKRRLLVFGLAILLVVLIVAFAFNRGDDKKVESEKVVDEIKQFSYVVSASDPKLFKEKFKELKKELTKKEVNQEKYAKLISELFVIDFYTLQNKNSKNDVGGVQFIYDSYKPDFVDKARDGIYKQVKSNLDNNRNQNLPEVENVSITSTEQVAPSEFFKNDTFKNVNEKEAYKINMTWSYKNDDDFQKEATLIVVKDGEKLSIAKLD